MSSTELIERAKQFHKDAGHDPDKYEYKERISPCGQDVKAYEIGTEREYFVAFYNSKSGRVVSALETFS
jgi:hypothetical protein